ncbi:MAG TPA: HRDC domain-containing protein [Opitutaceae bacterium]|nr:HRDC domain-containing protein [Opitutaceae bacterium]
MISRFLPVKLRRLLGVKVTTRPPAFQLIDRPAQLAPLLAALDRVKEVSLDTEADNMYHYRTRVCLLQFLVDGEVFLVDVLAPGLSLDELWLRLAKKHLVMHGSDFDLRLLHDLCGFRAHSLFDTMLAAQLLNLKRIGLAALLEENFGVAVDKSGQKANWSARPITPKLLTYAALDVWHLPALRDILTRELTKRGRLGWLEQQCRAQIEAGSTGFAPPDENDWRIGKSERLRGRGLAVLHAVWHWREAQAQRIDTAPFKVCGNEMLLRIATAAEAENATPEAVLGSIHLGRRHDRIFPSLAEAVRAGFARDPKTLPRRPGRDPRHSALTQAEVERLDRIKEDRDRVAAGIALDPTLIASRSQLAQIARAPGRIDEVLLRWQADLLRDVPSLKS